MPDALHAGPRQTDACLRLVLRGVLAAPSGCPDDPWRRVLLRPAAGGRAAAPVLDAGSADPAAAPEALRAWLRERLARLAAPPAGAQLPGGATVAVERPAAAALQPLAGKVALVTGAAGAIGAGLCRALLDRGAVVAAADLPGERLDGLRRELAAAAPGRAAALPMDVADPAAVAAGFAAAAEAFGGVDLVVANAGVAAVARLTDLPLDTFRRLERVNAEGTLLTLAEAGRCLQAQGTGGDIVLVSTKNVAAPGAQFGAYSATKAAAHQLARIASLELAPFDIRVNMVAPDAVFGEGARKSGLWAEVGPSRMKARGLDEQGLEAYYRDRNLLKARVTPEHVARAVLFFATRQTPTTGATLPVDGGLPDATPR